MHIVNQLQLDVRCREEDVALNLRHNFAHLYQAELQQVIDDVCSQYAAETDWIKIDKIEIDLGKFSSHSFGNNFTHLFRLGLEKEIKKRVASVTSYDKIRQQQVSEIELLKYFLLTGRIQWWGESIKPDINELFRRVINTQKSELLLFLKQSQHKPLVWRRISLQFSEESKKEIISSFDLFLSAFNMIEKRVVEMAIIYGIPQESIFTAVIPDLVFENAPSLWQAPGNVIIAQIVNANLTRIFSLVSALSKEQLTIIAGVVKSVGSPNVDVNEVGDLKEAVASVAGHIFMAQPDAEEFGEKIVVHQAGIVLLAPFLKQLFTTLSFVDKSGWVSIEAQFKGVHLLKYLSTGLLNTPEYELTLEKVLCGLPVGVPVALEADLNTGEIEEADELLRSVIEHWKALKNTSVNGLRNTFLTRDGILTKQDNGWRLQVERKTLDVLLENIPWGYATVNLPWNEEIIFVEW